MNKIPDPLLEAGPNVLRMTREGAMLYNRHDLYVGRSLELLGEYSPGETDLFNRILAPGHTAIEVGANIGSQTVVLAKRVGTNGKVHAFEPQQPLFQLMCANLALNGLLNTHAWNCAVDETPGFLAVPPTDYERGYNFGGIAMGPDGSNGYRVQSVKLDEAVGTDQISEGGLRLIKLDVEGMELAVLKGAAGLVTTFQPVIYTENNIQEKSPALIQWLLDSGYRLFWHLPFMFSKQNFYGVAENPFTDGAGSPLLSVNVLAAPSWLTVDRADMQRINGPEDWWRTS
ncbi:MAG: FkbM family methyltransferase [Alphaproteobacteria bacterium]|jgi:FkbM family methyltransferase